MTKVYAVVSTYIDGGLETLELFDNKEAAEEFLKFIDGNEYASIEEREVYSDAKFEYRYRYLQEGWINNDGSIKLVKPDRWCIIKELHRFDDPLKDSIYHVYTSVNNPSMYVYDSAISAEHAREELTKIMERDKLTVQCENGKAVMDERYIKDAEI